MFPTDREIADAYAAVAVRLGLGVASSDVAIRSALRDAEHLAEDVYESPAALLFAFSRVPRAFSGFRTMTVILALAQVRSSGQTLTAAGVEALGDLVEKVHRRECAYEDVRAYFADALLPYGG
jgi:hypothetical protein